MERIRRWTGVLTFMATVVVLGLCPPQAAALNQPPYNLGLTNALDAAIPGPGIYMMAYSQFYDADNICGNDDLHPDFRAGLDETSVTTLSAVWQIAWISDYELLGGFLGWNIVIPVVVLNTNAGIENSGGLGDIITGPVMQWSGKSLFGKPYFHRVELDVIFPTGKYSDEFLINPGSNIVTFNPYYAFTLFPTPKTDVSFRIHYAWNSKNDEPNVALYGPNAELQPGMNFHFNYVIQHNFYKWVWAGVAGYAMWQLNDDDLENPEGGVAELLGMVDAVVQKERVFGIGPIFTITPLKNLMMSWATAFEVGVKNRPEGFKTTVKVLYGF